MSKITWDATGDRLYETGVDRGVLYVYDSSKTGVGQHPYSPGVAWNGLTGVNETPDGAEADDLYADNIKYLSLISAEKLNLTITAYTYPDEFAICDGSESLSEGIIIGQQARKTFGFCYRTRLGNDTENTDHGYKLHLVYGCLASPSDRDYSTINDSPDAIEFSWEVNTTPVDVGNAAMRPTSLVTIDSTKVSENTLKAIEEALYGTETAAAYLPTPAELLGMVTA